MTPFINRIQEIYPISNENAEVFQNHFNEWSVAKDTLILKEKDVSYFYFLKKGSIRIYYYKNDKEITEWISLDGNFFLSIVSFFEQKPSSLIIQSIEPCEILSIKYQDLQELLHKNNEIQVLFHKMIVQSLILSQHRMYSIQFHSANERYLELITHQKEIVKRIPLTYIASFLGITLETLSRIRKNIS